MSRFSTHGARWCAGVGGRGPEVARRAGGASDPGSSPIPSPEEDKFVMHESFMHAYENSLSSLCRIPGMQSFAGGMLSRAKIPSQQYIDPLSHIFDEFDTDGNGILSATEVGEALRSREVQITDEQVRMFVRAILGGDGSNALVGRDNFKDLIMHMAAADFECAQVCGEVFGEEIPRGPTVCTFESDDEVNKALEAWRDGLLHSGALVNTSAGKVVRSLGSTDVSSGSEDDGGELQDDGTVLYRF
jgi:hypothetical protein